MTENIKPLNTRVKNAFSWSITGHISAQFIRFFGNLILTRLLFPEMFALMGIVSIFMMGITMFSDVGLQQNVVQSKNGKNKTYLNTVWTIQILRGGVVFFIALLISIILYTLGQVNLLGDNTVYSDPRLPFLLAVVSTTALISGFNSVNLLLRNRELMLGQITVLEIFSQLIGIVAMVLLAWVFQSIWALVIGGLISTILKMLFSHHRLFGDQCAFGWDKAFVEEIINFGKWIFIATILGFALSQGDRILLGLWLSPTDLGVYVIAFNLAIALKGLLQKLISTVFYPMFSEIVRTDPKNLKNIYYKIRYKVDFISMSLAGFLASTGHFFIKVLYDDRYLEAGWMLEIMSISMVFIGYSMAGMCLMAKGDSKSNTWLILFATSFLYITVPIAYYNFGVYGAIIAISLNYIIDIPTTFYMMKKNNLLDIKKEFRIVPIFFIVYFLGHFLIRFLE